MASNKELNLKLKELEQKVKLMQDLQGFKPVEINIWDRYWVTVDEVSNRITAYILKTRFLWMFILFAQAFQTYVVLNPKIFNVCFYYTILLSLICSIVIILISPYIVAAWKFGREMKFLSIKNIKNPLKIFIKFLQSAVVTFALKQGVALSMCYFIKIIIFWIMGGQVESFKNSIWFTIMLIIFTLSLFYNKPSSILIKSYMGLEKPEWATHVPTTYCNITNIAIFISIALSFYCERFNFNPFIDSDNPLDKELHKDAISAYIQFPVLGFAFTIHCLSLSYSEYLVKWEYLKKYNLLNTAN